MAEQGDGETTAYSPIDDSLSLCTFGYPHEGVFGYPDEDVSGFLYEDVSGHTTVSLLGAYEMKRSLTLYRRRLMPCMMLSIFPTPASIVDRNRKTRTDLRHDGRLRLIQH